MATATTNPVLTPGTTTDRRLLDLALVALDSHGLIPQCITPEQRAILSFRVAMAKSLEETATLLSLRREDVRQSEILALRALRRAWAKENA